MNKSWIGVLLCLAVVMGSCKKEHPERPDNSFKCECGEIRWNGPTYPLALAEYVSNPDSIPDRHYYVTADISDESEDFPHHLNIDFGVFNVNQEVFYPESDTNNVEISIQEVIMEEGLPLVLEYEAVLGVVNIDPQLANGAGESVNFNLQCSRVVNGNLVGEILSLTGDFTIE